MDISFAGFCQQVFSNPVPDGNGSAYFGRNICKWLDRRAECDRHMHRYKMPEGQNSYSDERCV